MGKIRRWNYLFVTWKGDHPPRHVHVFRDGRLVLKWNLDDGVPMAGRPMQRIMKPIADLRNGGLL